MKRLYRQDNKVFAGVCSGIGKYLDLDEAIIRLIFAGLFFSPFPIVIFYLIMWILIPKQPDVINNTD